MKLTSVDLLVTNARNLSDAIQQIILCVWFLSVIWSMDQLCTRVNFNIQRVNF